MEHHILLDKKKEKTKHLLSTIPGSQRWTRTCIWFITESEILSIFRYTKKENKYIAH